MTPTREEVWLFDLGMAEKVQPACAVSVPSLKAGAFLVQGVSTYSNMRAIRKLGALNAVQFDLVFAGVLRWLGQDPAVWP